MQPQAPPNPNVWTLLVQPKNKERQKELYDITVEAFRRSRLDFQTNSDPENEQLGCTLLHDLEMSFGCAIEALDVGLKLLSFAKTVIGQSLQTMTMATESRRVTFDNDRDSMPAPREHSPSII